jgi:hypothetical protein
MAAIERRAHVVVGDPTTLHAAWRQLRHGEIERIGDGRL